MIRLWGALVLLLAGCAFANPVEVTEQNLPVRPATSTAEPSTILEEKTMKSTATPHETSSLPFLGQAPELENTVWLNNEPLRLADLRGKVILLDMWTFG